MKTRIIHIITKLELGGAQQNTLYTVEHLDRRRFSVALWSGDGGLLNEEARRIAELDFRIVPELVREVRPARDWAALRRLARLLREEVQGSSRPVIVHTHSSKAGILGRWAAKWAGVPVIIHSFHGFGFNDFQPWPVKWLYIAVEWVTGRITDGFIAVSRANLERAVKLGLARPGDIRLIRSGIKISEFAREEGGSGFRRAEKMRELGFPAEGKLVLMVACLKPQKNPVDFVRMAARVAREVPEAVFALAGDGELRREVERAVAEEGLGEKMKLLGWRRDVAELLWSAEVLVLTSLWEGLPRVYPQAMAAGVPVVGTRVDGGSEAVADGENGWLLAPRDVAGMAGRVIELLQNPDMARAMGAVGRNRLTEFDIDLMVHEQEKLYEDLIASLVPR